LEAIAFFVLAVLTIVSALCVVLHRNPVVCALALAFHLVGIAAFFFLLGSQFIALLQVIVYAGAIMVLILFVIMLLSLGKEEWVHPPRSLRAWFGPVLAVALAALLSRALLARGTPYPSKLAEGYGTAASVGREVFVRFFYPFEVLSLLLLSAMIGAVLLAKRKVS
jgi:NADH-quinone oxidoreductase subunit J